MPKMLNQNINYHHSIIFQLEIFLETRPNNFPDKVRMIKIL